LNNSWWWRGDKGKGHTKPAGQAVPVLQPKSKGGRGRGGGW
jgi:hypothetical protein